MNEPYTVGTGEKYSVTLKSHGGHDATWVVVKANSITELVDLLDGIAQSGVSALIGNALGALRAEELLGSQLGARPVEHPGAYTAPQTTHQAPPPANTGGYSNPPQTAPQGSPYGPPPSCPHGTKKFLEKPYKNGKPGTWKAWACPAPQGDPSACSLQFIK
ncbi:DUF3824 domain-containing protein [Streptomyces sp. NPDC056230]|uniref:DUF3824 domain-containing protein n=1 Tax=Streptomyces sp. NPDC056230 TaxID=3345754 RepID=UPI0035DC9126